MSVKNRSLETILLLLAALALVAAVPYSARSDEKDEPAKEGLAGKGRDESAGGILKQFTGYTRPGYPSDPTGEGGAEATAIAENENAFGGTIYFAVFENMRDKAKEGDTFGTGFKDFDTHFRGG